jgi:hypothetical protein
MMMVGLHSRGSPGCMLRHDAHTSPASLTSIILSMQSSSGVEITHTRATLAWRGSMVPGHGGPLLR